MEGWLALEDGSVWRGEAFGAPGEQAGEVVFNTGMTGYQEILTDPSYKGQIVTMTYPLIGNYGINPEDFESARSHVAGFVVRECCAVPSNARASSSLEDFLREQGIIGLQGVDTRALTRRLRTHGTMKGIIATGKRAPEELVALAREAPGTSSQDLVRRVSTPGAHSFAAAGDPHVVVVDCGVKWNILRSLEQLGCRVTVVPGWSDAGEIRAHRPDGILYSNGPGDPKQAPYAIASARELAGEIPIMGICLGHQILALALGADTYKLKFGHRGANHPVKDLSNSRAYITSQNHGYAVEKESLAGTGLVVSHENLNDGTVEGISHTELPLFGVQYHPEACPGPRDSEYLFGRFLDLMGKGSGSMGSTTAGA